MTTLAPTEIYVDPGAAGGGDGSIGTPYNSIETAITSEVFDTTNGTRINVKSGTTDTLTADLSVSLADTVSTAAWIPSYTAPLFIQGYNSAANDGGVGVLSGGGTVKIFSNAGQDFVVFRDMRLTNCATDCLLLDDKIMLLNCEIDTSTGDAIELGADPVVIGNYIHDFSTAGLRTVGPGFVWGNVFDATGASWGILHSANDLLVAYNLVKTSAAGLGIQLGETVYAFNNSVFSTAGTGVGIASRATASVTLNLTNSVVAGLSGAGGVGIDLLTNASDEQVLVGGNSVYDCETAYQYAATITYDGLSDETLSAAPFNDATNLDFAPNDTGSLSEGSLPATFHAQTNAANVIALWRGGVEPAETGASGNEYQTYRGAVQPAYVAPVTPPAASSGASGHTSKRRRRLVQVNDKYVEVFSDEDARQLLNQEDEDYEEPTEKKKKKKRLLRMTPEVRAMIARYKKK